MTDKAPKPLYGQPCNGCGLCCLAKQCLISEMLFGEHDRCPALMDAGDRYACGLIAEPSRYFRAGTEAYAARACGELLGIGRYCDSPDDACRDAEARP